MPLRVWSVGSTLALVVLVTGCATAPTPSTAGAQNASTSPAPSAATQSSMVPVEQLTNSALNLSNGTHDTAPLSELSTAEKKNYPIYAVQATYAQLATYEAGLAEDSRIAPNEPMWALTVHAPIENDAPADVESKTWDVYTVVYDGLSGEMVSSSTGINLEKLGAPGAFVAAK